MFLVKSCKKKDNAFISDKVKIGTLQEYRKTESLQILDAYEGHFNITANLKNQIMSRNLFHHIQYYHNSDSSIGFRNFSISDYDADYVKVSFQADFNWINYNRFIFCITKIENHEESTTIFPDYDDYWYISFFKKNRLISLLESSLLNEVKRLLQEGTKIFNKDDINLEKLSVKGYSQDIIYSERKLHLDNDNFSIQSKVLLDLFNNIKFIKPANFKKEKEMRIVFDFYENNTILFPCIDRILIPNNISEIVKSQIRDRA